MDQKIKGKKIGLIIGIGNPGEEYEETYHNVGLLFVDYLTDKSPMRWIFFKHFQCIKTQKVIVAKTAAFMNNSGAAVREIMLHFKLKPENVLIAHDDADISLGRQRLVFGRGAAGHRGVESVIKALKTKNFWRLRIGIRPISPMGPIGPIGLIGRRKKAGEFVLKKISLKNKEVLSKTFRAGFEELQRVIRPTGF